MVTLRNVAMTRKAIPEYVNKVTAVFHSYKNGFNRYLDYINITKYKLRKTATLTKTKGPVNASKILGSVFDSYIFLTLRVSEKVKPCILIPSTNYYQEYF